MSACIFNFSWKALLQILPTTFILFRWNRSPHPFCTLCASSIPQTNKHVLSNCRSVAALHRYTIRHNSILEILVQCLRSSVTSDLLVYADLPDVIFFSSERLIQRSASRYCYRRKKQHLRLRINSLP